MKRTRTRRALRRSLVATLCAVALPSVAEAQPCDLGSKQIFCRSVEIKGKLWLDGDETKVKCKSGSMAQFRLWRDTAALTALADEACQALVAHAMIPIEQGDRGAIEMFVVSQPEHVARAGKPRDECVVQATYGLEDEPREGGPFISSLQGSWKFDAKTGEPKVLKADIASQYAPDATGVSARFIGSLKSKDCSIGSPH